MEEIQSLSKDGGDMPWRSAEVSKLKYLVRSAAGPSYQRASYVIN
jgi:hypothetical protein